MSVLVVLSSLLVAVATVPASFLDGVGDTFKKETSALINPVLEGVANITSSRCDEVKKLFGVSYEQTEKKDLDQLTLNYVTKDVNVTLNINSAAELLPKSPNFNDENFIIYCHGFNDDAKTYSVSAIANGYIRRGIYNFVALDASPYISNDYLRSTTLVKLIGEKLGSFLVQLVKEGLSPKKIHVMGHSLGAHIAAFTAKQFLKETSRRIGRVTGLDPAGPCFAQIKGEDRLSPNDADFVMVIHTDGVAGMKDPLGHADFFPNDGEQQPGCAAADLGCSHGRAVYLYVESLRNDTAFVGRRCDSWEDFKKGNCNGTSTMGVATDPGARGRYYLQTANASPYGLGQRGAKYENNEAFFKNLLG